MKGIVDRFEGDFVVIEIDGETQDVPRSLVADDVKTGDVVELQNNNWVRNPLKTQKRNNKIKKLMDSVWED
ncbi:DUF3006 domain-containing protein [Cohnella massiliensis]|uniref:DUF3006 domain-containing protein n=1 Tax=Cohnella massiliensis TaxID=1816691 RepID=UPI0009B9CC7C|nr:DUF3006 domain-containing protein [Cohnella massiliensis]